tara:strand:- start:868 stop:1524 length:657 start_codon:yes stop_codon:yes gene_type:complete
MNKCTIHQPDFLPWLGYFDKISKSDKFVILDDVQFSRRGWTHRDKILNNNKIQWLTVPTKKSAYYELIKNIKISYEQDWIKAHNNLLNNSYKNYNNSSEIIYEITKIYKKNYKYLIDLNLNLIDFIIQKLKIKSNLSFSSDLKIVEKKSNKIIKILENLNSKYYIAGEPSKNYLNLNEFKEKKIKIEWYNIENSSYFSKTNKDRLYLSSVDYLINKYD